MGNCCRLGRTSKKTIVLLLVGLDNAGKTVAVKGLAGENLNDSVPTIGFSIEHLHYLNYDVKIYDLGGGAEIRGIWHQYFVDAHGIIFVVDASDFNRFAEVKSVLNELLSHEKITGKPLLLLANKQDYEEALDEIDIVEKLELENLVNEYKCPTLVESCSAKDISKDKKTDPGIEKGYRWLLNYIQNDYVELNRRVDLDVSQQKLINDKLRLEKIERLKHEQIESNASPVLSIKSSKSYKISPNHVDVKRPKSAVQIVKSQLQNTNRRNSFLTAASNKTAPIILLSPKSAPITGRTSRASVNSGQILTITGLPNAIIDSKGENIGDLFEMTNTHKLPPLKHDVNNFHTEFIRKPQENRVHVLQSIDVDEICKDIS